jgi:hypothetical protein
MQLLSIVQTCRKAVVPGAVQVPVPESGVGAGSLPQAAKRTAIRNKITSVMREATAR